MFKKVLLSMTAVLALSGLLYAAPAKTVKPVKAVKAVPAKQAAVGKVGKLSDSNFATLVGKSKGYVIVDFWAPWCGPCQKQGPVFDKVANKFVNKVKFYKFDVDDAKTTAPKFSIASIPTMIIFKDGKEVTRLKGFTDEAALTEKLNTYVK